MSAGAPNPSVIRPREVRPGVASFPAITPTLPPATHTNSYALGTREVLLVEPATPFLEEQREWLAWARGLETRGQKLVGLFLTHHHMDHMGGAEDFSRALGLPLWGNEKTSKLVQLPFARHLREGDAIVLDGPAPQKWNVLHTPGHASDHLCLHEPELGVLVVGDMVASQGTILIAPGDGHMNTYLRELERLSALGASTALPAHGDPIETPAKLFRRYIDHRAARESRILHAIGAQPRTADEILPVAYFDAAEAVRPIARLSLLAHLEKLVEDGRVTLGEKGYAIA